MTAMFNPKDFLTNPSVEILMSLKKDDLSALAKHLQLPLKSASRKAEFRNLIIRHLVQKNILEKSASAFLEDPVHIAKLKLEMQRDLEIKKMQQQKEEKDRQLELLKLENERQEKERQYQLELRKLELQERVSQSEPRAISSYFDVTKHIRLVPPFQEKEVDKYFLHFEKIAENLKWPKEHWTLLVQSVLVGKAREIYTQLTVEQSHDYDTVKEIILKGYELAPEAYRQKFRNSRKELTQTHVEFARTKEQLLARWFSSKKIEQNFEKFRQLILVEEFKNCLHSDVKSFLDEKQVETLDEAARLANDYSLTHKISFTNKSRPTFSLSHTNSTAPSTRFTSPNTTCSQISGSGGMSRNQSIPAYSQSSTPKPRFYN